MHSEKTWLSRRWRRTTCVFRHGSNRHFATTWRNRKVSHGLFERSERPIQPRIAHSASYQLFTNCHSYLRRPRLCSHTRGMRGGRLPRRNTRFSTSMAWLSKSYNEKQTPNAALTLGLPVLFWKSKREVSYIALLTSCLSSVDWDTNFDRRPCFALDLPQLLLYTARHGLIGTGLPWCRTDC